MKKLVIVESECKAKRFKEFLDADYEVVTCYGAVRDLPEKEIGVKVTETDVEVQFITPEKSERTLEFLRNKVDKSSMVYLACDPDHEGEFMAFHLHKNLAQSRKDCQRFKRILCNELMAEKVKLAIEEPVEMDLGFIAAHLSRRVFDRLTGFKMASVLTKQFGKGVPANLRQAVALRMVMDREKKVKQFKPTEYWEVSAIFNDHEYKLFTGVGKKNPTWLQKTTAEDLMSILEVKNELAVTSMEFIDHCDKPPLPFCTATLLQAANKVLGLSVEETMKAAQKLYEWGYITYMRTKGTYVCEEAAKMARDHIRKKYGEEFVGKDRSDETYTKQSECIRPTKLVSGMNLVEPERSLLQLICKRFIASQMAACQVKYQVVKANNPALEYAARKNSYYEGLFFKCLTNCVTNPGYRQLLKPEDVEFEMVEFSRDEFLDVNIGDKMELSGFDCSNGQSNEPERFSEGTLVRDLEAAGVLAPRTIVPLMKALKNRGLIEMDGMFLRPTERGSQIGDYLAEWFDEITRKEYVAQMERQLELIANGEKWKPFVISFNETLEKLVEKVEK